MIQPLKSSKTNWLISWIDLEEPVPSGTDFFLPTLLIVSDVNGAPLGAPEVLEELDQLRVENYLIKLFEKLGTPDRLTVSVSEDWDEDAWRAFSQEQHLEIRFQKFDKREPDEIRALARSIVLRFATKESAAPRSIDVARGLVNTALRIRSPRKKMALLRTALARDADCASARIELADAEFQHGNWKASLAAYDELVTREIPRWKDKRPNWWIDRETRPLLRALYGRAMTLWHQGRHADSAEQFESLLKLSPKDYQGARFFIPLLYLLSEDFEAAQAAFEAYSELYPGDYSEPSFTFGWALSLTLEGRETEALAKYREAMLKNVYIAPMLLEDPEPPRGGQWFPNDRAEPAYAGEFIDSYAILWDREPAALRLLREAWQDAVPRVEKIVALREHMADFQDQRYEPDYKKLWQQFVEEDDRLTTP
jgi:tetratricopeptide (TPR) repeat protein